jgi:hypothetical protein
MSSTRSYQTSRSAPLAGHTSGQPPMRAHGLRALGVASVALLLFGCGIPVTVKRLSKEDAKKSSDAGLRYIVKRPSYAVSLRVVAEDDSGTEPTLKSCQASPGASPKDPACIKGETCNLQLTVEQKLEAEPLVFEATSHVNALADSEIEFALKEDGALSSVTAGETDKSLEIIKAAVGLAKTAAAASVGAPSLAYLGAGNASCRPFHDQLVNYLRRHDEQIRDLDCLKARARESEKIVLSGRGGKDQLDTVAALRTAVADKQKRIDEDRVEVPSGYYNLTIDDQVIATATRACRIDISLVPAGR